MTSPLTRRRLGVLAGAFLLPATARARGTLRADVDAAIHPLMAAHDIPGMAVGLIADGRPHVFNYGVSSRAGGAPVTDATIFEIGSISKVFTATLAAHAQATGHVSLDLHAGRYWPTLKGRPIDRATLLQLGTYTAGGLPLQVPEAVHGEAQLGAYFRDWEPAAPPGTLRVYSNPSIGLLGHITALATGEGFAEAVEARVLKPLGLAHSHYRVPAAAMPHYAWGHRDDNKAVRVNPGALDHEAYGVKTTAADLLSFVQANLDPRGLPEPLRQAIEFTQRAQYRVGPMVQGLGWEQYPWPVTLEQLQAGNSPDIIFGSQPATALAAVEPAVPRLFNKTGSTAGFGAYAVFVPERRAGLVLLANRNYPIASRVRVAHAILKQIAA